MTFYNFITVYTKVILLFTIIYVVALVRPGYTDEAKVDSLDEFVPDGPKIGFDCERNQSPLVRGGKHKRVTLESTTIIKKKLVLITGEEVFNLVCTRDKGTDVGDVVDVPDEGADEGEGGAESSSEASGEGGGDSEATTEAIIEERAPTAEAEETTVAEGGDGGGEGSTEEGSGGEGSTEEGSGGEGEGESTESDVEAVNPVTVVITDESGSTVKDESAELSARLDELSPKKGQKMGLTCHREQKPLFRAKSAYPIIKIDTMTYVTKTTITISGGIAFHLVCTRDKSRDKALENPDAGDEDYS